MRPVDLPPSNSIACPTGSGISRSNPPDVAVNLGSCRFKPPPSPPKSSANVEEQHTNASPLLPSNNQPAETPDPSPASCTASVEVGSGKLRKRVDFSPRTASTDFTDPELSVRSLPPSRECQSSKSILKQGRPSIAVQSQVSERSEDLGTMLDTILLQLAGTDRQIRLDAYMTLFSAWKAYAKLPGGHVTKEKIQTLVDFIRTDLTRWCDESMDPSETNLVLQALKLLVTVVWNKTLSVYLTDSDRSFLIDHSTRILEERKTPKAIILHYLHLLSTQDFSSRIMTTTRAIRLLEVLKDLPEHVRGNGVVSERLMVHQRILEQAKAAFKSKPSCWVPQLLSALTCSIADTRKKAIHLGHRVAIVLGSSSTLAKVARDSMDTTGEQGDVLSFAMCKRLGKMMREADEARQVPQIWGVVILLLRGLDQQFSQWNRLHDWLRTLQKCFNSSDCEVRVEANKAWNKLVCVTRPYGGTESFLTKMLLKPILVQLERQSNEKQSKSTRSSALAAYCNLLYYALKPSEPSSHYNAVWDDYIVTLLRAPFLSSEQNSDCACRILIALFWKERVCPWRENRALDAAVIEPEDLPLLDCKWIRSRTPSILQVFELLFRSSYWGPAAYPDTTYVAVAWRNFTKALGDACRKEVRASNETTEAVSHVSAFLVRICQTGPAAVNGVEEDFVCRFHFICKSVVLQIGPMSFAETNLSTSFEGSSIASSTKFSPMGRPPMVDLLAAFQHMPQNSRERPYYEMVVDLLQLTSKARSSVKCRVQFYKQCAQAVLPDGKKNPQCRSIWSAISTLASGELAEGLTSSSGGFDDAEDIVADIEKILELAVPYQSDQSDAWPALLKQALVLSDCLHRPRCVVIERLVARLRNLDTNEGGRCTAFLIREILEGLQSSTIVWTRNAAAKGTKRQVEKAKSVHGCVVDLLDLHLSRFYHSTEVCDLEVLESLVDVTIVLLQSSQTEDTLVCLAGLQKSLALWLEDSQRLMTTKCRAGSLKLSQARKICSAVIDVLGKLYKEIDLESFDELFAAAFKTSHKTTINQMVEMWNSTYGTSKSLKYGGKLREALARLLPFVDLELPGLHNLESQAPDLPMLDFLATQDDGEKGPTSEELPVDRVVDQPEALPTVDRLVQHDLPEATGLALTRRPTEAKSKQRPRHDNSQMHFVSIVSSSPLREDVDSQYLTSRQKEVRERQDREVAVLFPDIQSSPGPDFESSKANKIIPSLSLAEAEHDLLEGVDPATPTLLSRQGMIYEDAVQFSPTPRSKQQALRLEEIDVPSSPLSVQGVSGVNHQPAASEKPGCLEEVSVEPQNEMLPESEFFADVPAQSSHLDIDMKMTCPSVTEGPCTALPMEHEFEGQMHEEHEQSEHIDDQMAASEEVLPNPEEQVQDLPEKSVMYVPGGNVLASNKLINNEDVERTIVQIPNDAISLLELANTAPDGETAVTTPPTDHSNEINSEAASKTPIDVSTPLDEHIQVYSDDNDFWSASQLSQELEQVASSAPIPCLKQQADSALPMPAKRKLSPATSQASKRRKTAENFVRPRQASRLSSDTLEPHSSQLIYDCIEVESSPFSQQSSRAPSVMSQASEVSQVPKRGRGRPKKTQSQSTLPDPSEALQSSAEGNKTYVREPAPKIEVSVPSKGGSTQQRDRQAGGSDRPSGHPRDKSDRTLNPASATNRDFTPRLSSGEVKEDDKENGISPEKTMELLQKALSSLRRTSMDRSDLRAIDDLVFEIRTEAQNAAQRASRNGT